MHEKVQKVQDVIEKVSNFRRNLDSYRGLPMPDVLTLNNELIKLSFALRPWLAAEESANSD